MQAFVGKPYKGLFDGGPEMFEFAVFGLQGLCGLLGVLLKLALAAFEVALLRQHPLFLGLEGALFVVELACTLLEEFVHFRQVAALAGELLHVVLHGGVVAQLQGRVRAVDGGHGGLALTAGVGQVAHGHSHGLALAHQLGILFAQFLELLFGDTPAFHRLAVLGLEGFVLAHGDAGGKEQGRQCQHEEAGRPGGVEGGGVFHVCCFGGVGPRDID